MATALPSGSQGLHIEEVVPAGADVKGVSRASILQGRRRIRFQPQTGTTATAGSIIQFVLSDSTGLLDVNSMVLSYTAKVTTSGSAVLDEGIPWLRRAQATINGQLLEDVDNAHRAYVAEICSSVSMAWYRCSGTFAGFWRFAKDLVGNAVPYLNTAIAGLNGNQLGSDRRFNDVVSTLAEVQAQQVAGVQQGIPVGLIMPSFRSERYWPLRNMGELVLQFTTAAPGEAVWYSGSGATAGSSYLLQDIFLEVDIVVPHSSYAMLLDKICQDESEPGLTLPVDTRLVSQGQSISQSGSAGVAGATDSAVIVSRATNNLRKVMFIAQPTAGLASAAFPSVSCFGDYGFQSVQWRCGSLYFPSQPANSHARAFWMTSGAFGEPAQNENAGLANQKIYSQTTASSGAEPRTTYATLPNAAGTLDGTQTVSAAGAASARDAYADFKVLGYCFDNFKGTDQPLDYDGISVLGQAGSQLVTQIRNNPIEAITPTVILDATKYIHLKDGALRIIGA